MSMSNQGLITLRQLFAACHDFVDLLGLRAVLALALVSREVWSLARGLIEKRYGFRMDLDAQRFRGSEPIQFGRYAPRSFRLMGIAEDAPVFVVPESVVSLQMIFAQRAFGKKSAFALVERCIGATHLRLTELTFCDLFDGPVDHLPPCVTHLTFGYYFNRRVDRLPLGVTHLAFGACFNQPVDRLPCGVTHLTFGYPFNRPVDRLPPGVTHLAFGAFFDQPVGRLPCGVTHLTFGHYFDQGVDHLPPVVRHLTFGYFFNQPVDRLPPALTHLSLGRHFDQRVDHLPPTATHVMMCRSRFNEPMVTVGPTVSHLAISFEFGLPFEGVSRDFELLALLDAGYDSVSFSWEEIERRVDVVWLESGDALTAEQLSGGREKGIFRWKKPAAPPLLQQKRKRDEHEGGPSVKRT